MLLLFLPPRKDDQLEKVHRSFDRLRPIEQRRMDFYIMNCISIRTNGIANCTASEGALVLDMKYMMHRGLSLTESIFIDSVANA